MSAYVVDRAHVWFLVEAATHRAICPEHHRAITWFWNGKRREMGPMDYDVMANVGQMLWDENVRSVRHRYPDCGDDLPGPIGCDYQYGEHTGHARSVTPAQVLKACDGLEYQSCEHPEWEASEAFAFLSALRRRAWQSVDGYDAAEWEVTAA